MIWVLGAKGMLGTHLVTELERARDFQVHADADTDITKEDLVFERARELKPSWIVNCAAYTAVDQAEDEIEQAIHVNADGAGHLAQAAEEVGARLLHISTDYVFDGTQDRPYAEDDATRPLGAYGRSKEMGEQLIRKFTDGHVILRTSWLHGPYGPNFVTTMLRLMGEQKTLRVVNDQRGRPCYTGDLVDVMLWVLREESPPLGTLHVANGGACTWFEFAEAIQKEALVIGLLDEATPVMPVGTADYPTKAQRPANSVLDIGKLQSRMQRDMATWRDGLRRHLETRFAIQAR